MSSVRPPTEEPILTLVGPTAMGKTDVGIRLAEALDGEIISADSMAVYRGMDIGTAKPTAEERERIPFHLLDVADPNESFSVARFKALAEEALNSIRIQGKQALIVGGTGLYVRVLLEDYGLTQTPADPDLRARLDSEATAHGAPALHRRLSAADAISAARIHPNDRIRIVRALEVYERTGVPMSVQQAQDALQREPRPAVKFGLTADRETLYQRIDARVDRMVDQGLEREVSQLLARGYDRNTPSLRSLGYKEMAAYLHSEIDLRAAVDAIKLNTRRFAKRQLTWFRSDPDILWIDVGSQSIEQIVANILAQLKRI